MKIIQKSLLLSLFCLFAGSINAQSDSNDLSKQIQNPVASLISLPFQNNTDFGLLQYDPVQQTFFKGTRNTLNIQPVIPFALGNKVNLIVRTIVPIISLPLNIDKTQSGLGDINMSLYLTPANAGKIIYGTGLALGLPTAMHPKVLGTEKFSIGPNFVGLIQPGTWTIGVLAQNTWSVAGNDDRADINLFYSQIFITKSLQKGWYLNTAPIITANWEAIDGDKWTIPLGAGFGRLFKAKNLPINAQFGWYKYVKAPSSGPEHQLRAQIVLLFPK